MISNSGQPLNIPDNISSDEDKWNYYNDWLIENDLFSCLDGYPDKLKQHCSYNIDKKGYNYNRVENRVTNFINGVEESFYDNGKIQSQITWHNGQRYGLAKTFFENGKLDRKASYVNDNMHGHYERYHENGQLRSIGQLVNDEQSGHWEWYDENGNLIETKEF